MFPAKSTPNTLSSDHILIKIFPWATGLLLVAGYAFLFYNLNKTLDLSDEGFYLLEIFRPFDDAYKIREYGALLHPIFLILDENVYALRLFGLVTLALNALFFGFSLSTLVNRLGFKLSFKAKASLLCAVVTASLSYYFDGLLTPSYNWCNLNGVLIFLASICLYTVVGQNNQSLSPILARLACLCGIAFGGVISFLGKPTTAAGIAIVGVLWITLFPQMRSRRGRFGDIFLSACIAAMLLAFHFTFLSEGIITAISKYKAGIWVMSLVPDYSFSSFMHGTFFYPGQHKFAPYFIGIFTLYLLSSKLALHNKLLFLSISLFIAATCGGIYLIMSQQLGYLNPILILLTFVLLIIYRDNTVFSFKLFLLPLFIFITLYFYYFGSNNVISYIMSKAFVILVGGMLAAFSLTKPEIRNQLVTISALVLSIFALASLTHFIEMPFGQNAPLWALNAPLKLRENSTPLYVTQSRKEFMECVRKMALTHGWRPGMPMLHLSFDVSAVPFMLQAQSTGTQLPLRPVYMKVKDLVQYYRKAASYEDLRRSWIFCYGKPELKPKAFVPISVLMDLGLPFPQSYEMVGTCDGWQLWKPISDLTQGR
jgi:hypothetical protein